jgi:hypothetical protein
VYNFTYQYVYEPSNSSLVTRFASFLNSIMKEHDTIPGRGTTSPPGFNPALNNTNTRVGLVQNYFYNATRVEDWIDSNQTLFGSAPLPGYTLLIADLHNLLPSLSYTQYQAYTMSCPAICPNPTTAQPHYYNRTVTDPDLGLKMYRHFMTGWGGTERTYFMDLSAGPSYVTNELPVQVAAGLRGLNLSTPYGKIWLTQFVDEYIFGAINNLFAADQLYPVSFAQKYNFQLFVFDNRTAPERATGPRLPGMLNTTLVQSQLSSLLPPSSSVVVSAKFWNITAFPKLAAVVANATTRVKDPSFSLPIVDGRLVWNWLSIYGQGHVSQFVNATRTTSEYDIPAFIFAFQGNYTFAFNFKESIESGTTGSFGGIALGDMALVDQSEYSLTFGNVTSPRQPGKGVGFTHNVIHELGHMMGLNHPFIYDLTEDFVNSIMGYYAYALSYSQFDRDTILRGINDELLIVAQDALDATGNSLVNSGTIAAARQKMALANQHYSTMDYAGAVQYSLAAALDALQAEASGSLFSPGLVFGLIGLAVGVAIGVLLGFFFFKKRKTTAAVGYNLCPTCQQPVRWDPVQMKWHCDRCQKPV